MSVLCSLPGHSAPISLIETAGLASISLVGLMGTWVYLYVRDYGRV